MSKFRSLREYSRFNLGNLGVVKFHLHDAEDTKRQYGIIITEGEDVRFFSRAVSGFDSNGGLHQLERVLGKGTPVTYYAAPKNSRQALRVVPWSVKTFYYLCQTQNRSSAPLELVEWSRLSGGIGQSGETEMVLWKGDGLGELRHLFPIHRYPLIHTDYTQRYFRCGGATMLTDPRELNDHVLLGS